MSIPPFDLTRQYQQIGAEIDAVVTGVLASGRYIGGEPVERFEREFAAYVGTPYAVSCNSGTDALYLALRSLRIGPGDEVITTPFTFFATAEVISAVGATPIFVDIEPESLNLNLEKLEAAITTQTRAILPVHLFGQPVDLQRLGAIAAAHNLAVVEDCAQATGAEWQGRRVGSVGTVGCFSFFPTKNLGGCGDGGILTTHDPEIAATARMLREHGSRQRYYHEAIGLTSRLDALQAAILSIKLRYLDRWNEQRRAIAADYTELLAAIPGVMPPHPVAGGLSVWHQYVVRITDQRRDQVKAKLQEQGITTMIYYPVPLHRQVVYESLSYAPGVLAIAEQAATEVLALPMFPELSREEQTTVVAALTEILQRHD